MKDEAETDKEHVVIETEGKNSLLFIKYAKRTDHGKYQISGTNNSGTKSAVTRVDVMDVPGPVVNLKTTHVTKKNISLSWEDPLDNGGSDVIGYVVEKKDAKMQLFRQPIETASCKCDIQGLLSEEEYDFRVFARNKYGDGAPTDIGPILAS
uniref:Fibronectin type-III domain-containing protein n=1 Tax=Hucho hucho TaxID=62062 RepID=A0A4W5MN37_9TELE